MVNVYTFDKGSRTYDIIRKRMSRRARKKLHIRLPIFGEYRNKAVIPSEFYQAVLRTLMEMQTNPDLYLDDVIVEYEEFEAERDELEPYNM